jgi:hypothetical protein
VPGSELSSASGDRPLTHDREKASHGGARIAHTQMTPFGAGLAESQLAEAGAHSTSARLRAFSLTFSITQRDAF